MTTAVRWARDRDVGVAYALVVTVIVVVVSLAPTGEAHRVVLESSTNLHNLRTEPLLVLLLSAFVVPSVKSLWVLPLLIGIFGAAQTWLGRGATVLVAASGHVLSTVFVAMLVNAGIAHHELSRRIANEPDVGVSYGLAALLGVLAFRLQGSRRLVITTASLLLVTTLVVSQTFTDLGHLVAWGIGLSMGYVGTKVRA